MGIFGWVLVIIFLISWKKLTGHIISVYMLFAFFLFAFCYGQALLYPFNLVDPVRDVFNSYWASSEYVFVSEYFSLICICAFHFGGVVFLTKKAILRTHDASFSKNEVPITETKIKYKSFFIASLFFLIISSFPFVLTTLGSIQLARSSGYDLSLLRALNNLPRILILLDNFFIPSLFCIYIISIKCYKHVRLLFVPIFAIHILISLYIGIRSSAMVIAMGLLLIEHFFVKKFKGRRLVLLFIIAYFALVVVSGVGKIRSMKNRQIQDVITAVFTSFINVDFLFETLTMFGKQINTLMKSIELVPSIYPYRYGSGYFWAFTSIIPNMGFWDVHPAETYSNFEAWLAEVAELDGFAPGFNMITEAYINGGLALGWLFMIPQGWFVSLISSKLNSQTIRRNPDHAILAFLITLAIATLPRQTSSLIIRDVVYYCLTIFIFAKLIARLLIKKQRAV